MEYKVKTLLLGGVDVPYHPLTEVKGLLETILSEEFEITVATSNDVLTTELSQYKLLISYVDQWDKTLTNEQTAGLVTFVVNGGGLLTLHNGICLSSRYEIKSIIGASFTSHPEAEVLRFSAVGDDEIIQGIQAFDIHEEPYQYDFYQTNELNVFLEYTYQEKQYPSGWSSRFGSGRTIYLHPGHSAVAFQTPNYQDLIRRCAHWCVQ